MNGPDRFAIERAVKRSELSPGARLVMMMLCTRMDGNSNRILPGWQPSLNQLAEDTGQARRTVQNALDELERGGWITRTRARRGEPGHAKSAYQLHVPEGAAAPSDTVRRTPKARATVALDEQEARATVALDSGNGCPRSRATVATYSSSQEISSRTGEEIEAVKEAIEARTGARVDTVWALKTRDMILSGKQDVKNRPAYLRACIASAPIDTYRPTPTPRPFRASDPPVLPADYRLPA